MKMKLVVAAALAVFMQALHAQYPTKPLKVIVPVTTGGHTRLESMVITTPLRYATLGHLRRHIERAWSPNPKVAAIMECKA